MRNLLFTITILATTTQHSVAQFNLNSTLKNIGNQVQRQATSQVRRNISSHVQRHAPQIVREVQRHVQPKHVVLPHPTPRPTPRPCPKPVVRPLPRPNPKPCPVVHPPPIVHPHPVVVKPCPTHKCVIRPVETVVPVQPIVPAPTPVTALPTVEAGQQVTIDGRLFGSEAGSVALKIGDLVLRGEVTGWTSTQATAILPQLPMTGSTRATVIIYTAYGKVADSLEVNLVPASTQPAAANPGPVAETELPVVTPGQEITLESANMGHIRGKIQMLVSGLTLNARVTSWLSTKATARLPELNFASPVKATIQIVRPNGEIADQVDVTFAPATNVAAR